MAAADNGLWLRPSLALALVAVSATAAAFSVYVIARKSKQHVLRIRELENSLERLSEKCSAERNGRTRAQQDLRKSMVGGGENLERIDSHFYPMAPIAVAHSCFSTRNGTPRQPLLVPLARACVMLNSARAPAEALEGLAEYSHCWVLYVFHLNTDLQKLWREPFRSKFKAKVRVPRLRGDRIGALATRSPHRPCPIGLSVAKVEAVKGRMILLSGVDLVDGTPILDIKPYLPYSDMVPRATIPKWLMEDKSLKVSSVSFSPIFSSALQDIWAKAVLSWDIRSVSQQNQPRNSLSRAKKEEKDDPYCSGAELEETSYNCKNDSSEIIYHLMLEGVDISYRIDCESHVIVVNAELSAQSRNDGGTRCNYMAWKDNISRK